MSDQLRGLKQDSEESDDIFQANFSSSASSGKKVVKISGGFPVELPPPSSTPPQIDTEDDYNVHNENKEKGDKMKPELEQVNNARNEISSYQQQQQQQQPQVQQQHKSEPVVLRTSYTATVSAGGYQGGGGGYISSSSPDEVEEEGEDTFIEVTVSEPHKVGEGISSYVAYRVTTKTNLKYFNMQGDNLQTVSRRFSDFLGLHEKLGEKYRSRGRIIPPAPEKSLVGTTKVKMSSTSGAELESPQSHQHPQREQQQQQQQPPTDQAEFIARRRFALERFINRVCQHPVFRRDAMVIEFLTSNRDLPRATSTSALSSAAVMRFIGKAADTVNKITTYKMEENDPWYQEKIRQIDALEAQLKKLYGLVEGTVQCRHELAVATGSFAQGAALLSNAEEAHSLARALAHLARVEEKIELVHHRQAEADYYHLFELIKDYVALVGAVKDALNERAKAFGVWQHAQMTLSKKKEAKARLEMGGKMDKIPTAGEEVIEWEGRLQEGQDNFKRISEVVKTEIDLFERYRVKDFKVAIVQYLEALMNCQMQMVKHWEEFLPEVKSILF